MFAFVAGVGFDAGAGAGAAAALGAGAAAGAGVGAGLAAGAAAGGVAGFAIGADFFAGAAAEAANQLFTPLWPRHAPDLLDVVAYVPSLQRPVEPAGAPAGACATQSCEIRSPDRRAKLQTVVFIDPPIRSYESQFSQRGGKLPPWSVVCLLFKLEDSRENRSA